MDAADDLADNCYDAWELYTIERTKVPAAGFPARRERIKAIMGNDPDFEARMRSFGGQRSAEKREMAAQQRADGKRARGRSLALYGRPDHSDIRDRDRAAEKREYRVKKKREEKEAAKTAAKTITPNQVIYLYKYITHIV